MTPTTADLELECQPCAAVQVINLDPNFQLTTDQRTDGNSLAAPLAEPVGVRSRDGK